LTMDWQDLKGGAGRNPWLAFAQSEAGKGLAATEAGRKVVGNFIQNIILRNGRLSHDVIDSDELGRNCVGTHALAAELAGMFGIKWEMADVKGLKEDHVCLIDQKGNLIELSVRGNLGQTLAQRWGVDPAKVYIGLYRDGKYELVTFADHWDVQGVKNPGAPVFEGVAAPLILAIEKTKQALSKTTFANFDRAIALSAGNAEQKRQAVTLMNQVLIEAQAAAVVLQKIKDTPGNKPSDLDKTIAAVKTVITIGGHFTAGNIAVISGTLFAGVSYTLIGGSVGSLTAASAAALMPLVSSGLNSSEKQILLEAGSSVTALKPVVQKVQLLLLGFDRQTADEASKLQAGESLAIKDGGASLVEGRAVSNIRKNNKGELTFELDASGDKKFILSLNALEGKEGAHQFIAKGKLKLTLQEDGTLRTARNIRDLTTFKNGSQTLFAGAAIKFEDGKLTVERGQLGLEGEARMNVGKGPDEFKDPQPQPDAEQQSGSSTIAKPKLVKFQMGSDGNMYLLEGNIELRNNHAKATNDQVFVAKGDITGARIGNSDSFDLKDGEGIWYTSKNGGLTVKIDRAANLAAIVKEQFKDGQERKDLLAFIKRCGAGMSPENKAKFNAAYQRHMLAASGDEDATVKH
ncbi:MAG: hypothetical protein WCG06_05595, partial [Candidatus Omnitrophota bacterium]